MRCEAEILQGRGIIRHGSALPDIGFVDLGRSRLQAACWEVAAVCRGMKQPPDSVGHTRPKLDAPIMNMNINESGSMYIAQLHACICIHTSTQANHPGCCSASYHASVHPLRFLADSVEISYENGSKGSRDRLLKLACCQVCQMHQPLRTKHCRDCGMCVRDLPVIGLDSLKFSSTRVFCASEITSK